MNGKINPEITVTNRMPLEDAGEGFSLWQMVNAVRLPLHLTFKFDLYI